MSKSLGLYSIEELFEQKLKIPTYQRPYLWKKEQVENLLKDFLEIFEKKEEKIYLIGNMIFYKNTEDELEIVDGQQRTITLALLLYNLDESKESKDFLEKLEIGNPLSKKAIYDNNQIIKNFIDRQLNYDDKKGNFLEFLANKVLVTYIVAQTQDEAFVFFDSQNTRGKPLFRHDLLKAHHLRDNSLTSEKRVSCAKIWENYREDKLKKLLEVYLTLNRNFVKGNYKFDIDVYKEFKSNTFSNKINNYNQPPIFQSVSYSTETKKLNLHLKDSVELKIGSGLVLDEGERYLPFEVLQSIGGGEEFFWYISKYIGVNKSYEELLNKDAMELVNSLSTYLRDYFDSITFLYYDKFGDEKFNEFSYLVLWLISYYRLDKYSVRYLGVRNFIEKYNIFSKLFFSYSSDEIIDKINTIIKYELGEVDNGKASEGIRETYYEKIKDKKELNNIAKLVKD